MFECFIKSQDCQISRLFGFALATFKFLFVHSSRSFHAGGRLLCSGSRVSPIADVRLRE